MTEEKKELPPTTVITGKCRGHFMWVFDTRPNDKGEQKYSAHVLGPLKTDTVTIAAIRKAIEAAKQKGIEKKIWSAETLAALIKEGELKMCIRDGDKELATGKKKEKYREMYEGSLFFNASSKNQPAIVDAKGKEIIKQSEIYNGAFYRFEINFYPYDVSGNQGIAAGLNAVQKVGEGKHLSGGSDGSSFGNYESTEVPDEDIPF